MLPSQSPESSGRGRCRLCSCVHGYNVSQRRAQKPPEGWGQFTVNRRSLRWAWRPEGCWPGRWAGERVFQAEKGPV